MKKAGLIKTENTQLFLGQNFNELSELRLG